MAYPSPRRLQLRRGNAAAVASYLGYAGELVVDTTNWTLYVHDGVTVGGRSTSVNTASINSNITAITNGTAVFGNIIPSANVTYSLGNVTHQWRDLYVSNTTIYIGGVPLSINASGNLTVGGNTIPTTAYVNQQVANVTVDLSSYALNANVTAANVGLKGYVDQANSIQSAQLTSANVGIIGYINQANTIQSQQITAANVGIIGYIDRANTIQSGQVGAANLAITAANVGLKGYVDLANTIQSSQLTAANTAWAANASAQQTLIYNLQSSAYSNSNVTAFLVSHTDQTIGGNLTIQGNLIVNGNVSYVNVNNLVISDNIINLADLNPGDSLDLGLSAHRTVNDILQHTGLVRDASANQWRLFSNVIPQPGTTVDFTNAVYDDLLVGNILLTSVKNGAYTWTFGANGTLTVPASGTITAPNAQEFQLQAKDTNSLLRNEINLDPNNGTYMSVWSEELETSFNTSDWATGSWENLEGVPGVSSAFFTNAEALQDFWTTGFGSFVNSVEVSINGGARMPVSYDGNNGETYGALLLLTGVPATSPTTITSLTFYYRTKNSINIDYAEGEILLDGQALNINLQTTNGLNLQSSQTLDIKNIGQQPVRIFTDNTTHTWEFDSGGSLTLPREGRITGIGDGGPAGDRYGYISWDGNSSGDGSGFNTMRLVPDLQGLEDLDQYIIIDPTGGVPGHIHIRAGGTQDNSLADLYLGGEHSHVKISAGANPPVTVMSNNNAWTFGTDGNLTLPNTATVSINYANGVSILSGLGGSSYGNAQVATYLQFGNIANVSVAGNVTANYFVGNGALLTGIVAGSNYSNVQVAAYLSTATINTTGNITAQYISGNISITGNVTGTSPNVTLQAGAFTSVFNNQGNVTVPQLYSAGNIQTSGYIYGNGAFLTGIVTSGGSGTNYSNVNVKAYTETMGFQNYGNVNVAAYISSQGLTSYSNVQVATYLPTYTGNIANIRLGVSGVLTFADGTTMITASAGGGSSYSNVNVAAYLTTYGGAIQSSNVQTTTANIQSTTAATNTATGALRVMGGIGIAGTVVAGHLNSTGNVLANAISAYSLNTVANVTASVVNAGTINSAGNLLAQNLIGTIATASQTNITAVGTLGTLNVTGNATVGNLVGTEANTRIIANVYTTTFDIYGNVSFPGNVNVSGLGVTMPARPAFRVNGTSLYAGAQSTANVNLKDVAVSTVYNQGNYFDAATGKFTAPIAGIYEVLLNARVNFNFNGLAQLVVLKNGLNSAGNIVAFWETTSNIGGATHFGVSGTVVLATGDYLSANILAGNVTFDQNDNWSVTYLG